MLADATQGVSRTHAELRFRRSRCVIVDLESQNDTWINGQRVEHAEVPPAAEITVFKKVRGGSSRGSRRFFTKEPSSERLGESDNFAVRNLPNTQVMKLRACTAALLVMKVSALAAYAQANPAPEPSARLRERYVSAQIEPNGTLAITTADGRTIVVPKEGEQTSFGEPAVSVDGSAVGVQANYANCCTSYDIPLQLIVYSNGKLHRFAGIGLPIFQWHFADAGTRVAYGQEPVHFGCEVHYELREIESERLIDSVEVPQSCGLHPNPPEVSVPHWVKELNAKRQ